MPSDTETNPYTPPQSVGGAALPAGRRATKLAKTGAWLQLLPLVGIIGTVLGMIRAFATLKASGAGDPAKLSAAIGEVLIATAFGFLGGMVGCLLLGLAVFAQGRQPRWVKVVFWISALPALYAVFTLLMAALGGVRGGP